jgi:hypothetical protein
MGKEDKREIINYSAKILKNVILYFHAIRLAHFFFKKKEKERGSGIYLLDEATK